jgi:hypothetical protein
VLVAAAAGSVLVLAAGCSSSSHPASAPASAKVAASPVKQPAATPTTQAVGQPVGGLKVNADEQSENIPDKPVPPAQRAELAGELVIARATAMKYPTVADATNAGFILAGKFTPGAGAHYISLSGSASSYTGKTTTIDPAHPLALIYDGTAPTSRVVGLMYGSFAVNPPSGFAGPNDHWHRHSNVCVVFGKAGITIPFAPDSDVKKSECDAQKGDFMRETLWMVHAWVVPGWESPQGVFSHANPDLHCADGTDHTDKVGFCAGATT